MKQRLFSLTDDFVIHQASGEACYRVEGKVFSLSHHLSFQDREGRELATIQKRLLTWGPTYEIEREGRLAAVVTKELFSFFHCRFTVDVPGPDDLEAEGDFLDQEYVFRRGNHVVAKVSKAWLTLADTYGLEIAEGEDAVLLLASAIIIDQVCHED